MSIPPARPYHSPIRQRQADETRQCIATAARGLFLANGFDGTTIEAIAREAGVAPQTVYAVFGSKRGIVAELLDRARFGPGYVDQVEKAAHASDPADRLRLVAGIARRIFDAERAELEILRGAGALELGAKEREREDSRREAQAGVVDVLVASKRLRKGLDVEATRDVLWTFTGRDIYRMLVLERGWASDRYEAWLGEFLVGALLRPPAAAAKNKTKSRAAR
jgi:AcrR family transcriptional regulator